MHNLIGLVVPEEVFIMALPVGGGILIALTAIVTSHRRKMQRDDMEATLKMEMIERGMSAGEIERVLAARLSGSTPQHGRPHQQRH